MPDVPKIIPRPKLALWMFERGLKPRDAVAPLGVKENAVRTYLRPFGDPARQIPKREIMRRVLDWTAGEVGPADFYEPSPVSLAVRRPLDRGLQ